MPKIKRIIPITFFTTDYYGRNHDYKRQNYYSSLKMCEKKKICILKTYHKKKVKIIMFREFSAFLDNVYTTTQTQDIVQKNHNHPCNFV